MTGARQSVIATSRADLEEIVTDPAAHGSRVEVCEVVPGALQAVGLDLWVGGCVLRDDWLRGLGMVVQIGGELAAGALSLLRLNLDYPAATLVRQVVEVEYLVDLFDHDPAAARTWCAGTPNAVRKLLRPAALRQGSAREFRDSEYWRHCDVGGHPNPAGSPLLPGHSRLWGGHQWMWGDLAQHLARLWESLHASLAHRDVPIEPSRDVLLALTRWYETDAAANGIRQPDTGAS